MAAGQVSGYTGARALVSSLPATDWLLGDRGYDADLSREDPVNTGIHDIAKTPLAPTDAAQSLHFHVLAAIGQFEKDRFAERRAVGIAKAKAEGKYIFHGVLSYAEGTANTSGGIPATLHLMRL